MRKKLAIVTTVPETLRTILFGQPAYLSGEFDVTVISSGLAGVRAVAEQEGVSGVAVPMVRGISVFRDMWSVLRMAFVLARLKPDMLHSYTPKAGLVSMLAAWACRVPVRVHTFTGLIFPTSQGFKQALLILIDRLICACATHVVPEGLGVQKDLERFDITRKPLKVIGHGNIAGVDTAYFSKDVLGASSLRTEIGIKADDFVFCYVGRLNRDKGLAELTEAFTRLNGEPHLLLVGGLDETAPPPQNALSAIESHPRIHALGFLTDIRAALAASDVCVLPSYREGFPNVVLQAGAMQLPSIVTDISGCNEVIESGFNGWLVPARDEQALHDAMAVASQTPESVLAAMGQRARCRIKDRFERDAHWIRMSIFYKELCGVQPAELARDTPK